MKSVLEKFALRYLIYLDMTMLIFGKALHVKIKAPLLYQPVFICSKSAVETPEQHVKSVQT